MSEPTRPNRIRVSGEPPTITRLPTRYERETHEDPGTATIVILVVLAAIALAGLFISLHLMQAFA